jgi:hypothetical protein
MTLNVGMCKITQFDLRYLNEDYYLKGVMLQLVTEVRDIGVLKRNNLKCEKQCEKECAKAVQAANSVWGNQKNF